MGGYISHSHPLIQNNVSAVKKINTIKRKKKKSIEWFAS
jgi:hypothetical protein